METDYSKHMHFRWKIKWRLEHLGALGIMDEMVFRPRFEGQPRKTENEFNHNRLKRPCYGVIDVVN